MVESLLVLSPKHVCGNSLKRPGDISQAQVTKHSMCGQSRMRRYIHCVRMMKYAKECHICELHVKGKFSQVEYRLKGLTSYYHMGRPQDLDHLTETEEITQYIHVDQLLEDNDIPEDVGKGHCRRRGPHIQCTYY